MDKFRLHSEQDRIGSSATRAGSLVEDLRRSSGFFEHDPETLHVAAELEEARAMIQRASFRLKAAYHIAGEIKDRLDQEDREARS